MKLILIELYPQLVELNEKERIEAINIAPYLTEYINKDNELIKSTKSLLKSAQKEFNEQKLKVTKQFEKALEDKDINSKDFTLAVNGISKIAKVELGEYIVYRNNIIKALERALNDSRTKESFIHNLFIPMRTEIRDLDSDKHLMSNLWLLDDKFMTYSYVASDKSINQMKKTIKTIQNLSKGY